MSKKFIEFANRNYRKEDVKRVWKYNSDAYEKLNILILRIKETNASMKS